MAMPSNDVAPFIFVRDDRKRRVRITVRRTLQRDDIVAMTERKIRESAWTYSLLCDFSATADAVSRADGPAIAEYVREQFQTHGRPGPVAVVTRDPKMIGTAQLYARLLADGGVTLQIFWSADEADRWLDEQQGRP